MFHGSKRCILVYEVSGITGIYPGIIDVPRINNGNNAYKITDRNRLGCCFKKGQHYELFMGIVVNAVCGIGWGY